MALQYIVQHVDIYVPFGYLKPGEKGALNIREDKVHRITFNILDFYEGLIKDGMIQMFSGEIDFSKAVIQGLVSLIDPFSIYRKYDDERYSVIIHYLRLAQKREDNTFICDEAILIQSLEQNYSYKEDYSKEMIKSLIDDRVFHVRFSDRTKWLIIKERVFQI